jgi:hypothetical protein
MFGVGKRRGIALQGTDRWHANSRRISKESALRTSVRINSVTPSNRTRFSTPYAIVAVWGYELKSIAPAIDKIVRRWNDDTLSPFWEPERQHVVAHYETLLFDFEPLPTRGFDAVAEWDLDEFIGHLQTWSAYQKMKKEIGDRAFLEVVDELRSTWGASSKQRCVFTVFMKLGRVVK